MIKSIPVLTIAPLDEHEQSSMGSHPIVMAGYEKVMVDQYGRVCTFLFRDAFHAGANIFYELCEYYLRSLI